ncbi:MAG: hypothetical protein ABIJ25_04940 [Pseudomonadota bacterium]
MTRDQVLKIINIAFPAIGVGLMIFYGVCDTSCSSLQGTFLGVDLKVIGILYMAVLLSLTLSPASRWAASVHHQQTMLLSGALGGEILLVRFQVVQDTYCPFCLAFGSCILVLFAANFTKMNKHLALGAFLAGIATFALFFDGSVLPLYR